MKLTITITVLSALVVLALSEDIPNCPVCPSNIYLPEHNCSKFWQCANGVATLKECPCDLHFNPKADVCDWMWNFEHDVPCRRWTKDDLVCKAPETTTKPIKVDSSKPPPCPKHCPYLLHVPDGECCKYFWQCDQGRAYRLKCPDGLVFNPDAKVCDYNKGQKERGWTSDDLICHDISTQKPCCEGNRTTVIPKGPHCPEGCSATLMVPDPNCTHWWDCNNGIATKMSCPANLWWDSIRNTCDYPNLAYCDEQGWDEKELRCPPTTSTSSTTKMPSPTSSKPPKCPVGVKYLPNPNNCATYYQCTNGAAILMPCPAGLYWNARANYCDWPKMSGCKQPS